MDKTTAAAWTLGWALAGCAPLQAAPGLQILAQDLARPAQAARISRVAVLPLSPADQSPAGAGRIIAERLLTELVRAGGVAAVERALLEKLMAERDFSFGGPARRSGRQAVGRVLSVDGLVVGSFMTRGKDLLVRARLVDVRSGQVVAAAERALSRRGLGLPADPGADGQEPVLEYCVGADEQVDRLEGDILDLKARYWALQMRRGASLSSLRVFPGAAITDLELRQTLYDKMNEWYSRRRIPELTSGELQRLLTMDRRAYLLHEGCARNRGV